LESWIQIVISLGTFTVINLSATAFLVGKIVQTVKDHGEQIDELRETACKLKERLSPISSDDRLISAKDCIDGKAMVASALNEIKTMLKNAAQRQEDRMDRIESRREELMQLVFNLTGKFEGMKNQPREK
jgi:hypothetical protein